jgi:hypothetical protein
MRFVNLYRATWRYFGLGAALLSTVMNLVSPSRERSHKWDSVFCGLLRSYRAGDSGTRRETRLAESGDYRPYIGQKSTEPFPQHVS